MRRALLPILLATTAVLAGPLAAQPRSAAPTVVVTIAPVHSLVAAVMSGIGEPALLLEGGASPHTYSLRPSDARLLEAADLIVRVGPALETFLERPLASLAPDARLVTLLDEGAVERLPARTGGAWEAHDHDHRGDREDEHAEHGHEEEHAHGEEHEHHEDDGHGGHSEAGGADAHLWLSVDNARAIAALAAEALAGLDPENAAAYRDNAARLDSGLADLDAGIARIVAPVRTRPYVVFHDAYRYFEHDYGTNAVGAITVSPDQRPGARRLAEIRETLARTGADCVFREPQFPPALADTVVGGSAARIGVLDPIGANLAPGPALYGTLMRNLAESLAACLSGER